MPQKPLDEFSSEYALNTEMQNSLFLFVNLYFHFFSPKRSYRKALQNSVFAWLP